VLSKKKKIIISERHRYFCSHHIGQKFHGPTKPEMAANTILLLLEGAELK
jgi:hypothetical protein